MERDQVITTQRKRAAAKLTRLDCRHEYLVEGKFWIHAIGGGSIVDHIPVGAVSLVEYNGWAWVNDLFVRPDVRRCGIGRALLAEVAEAAGSILPKLPLGAGVNLANEASLSLFKSNGWTVGDEYQPNVVLLTK